MIHDVFFFFFKQSFQNDQSTLEQTLKQRLSSGFSAGMKEKPLWSSDFLLHHRSQLKHFLFPVQKPLQLFLLSVLWKPGKGLNTIKQIAVDRLIDNPLNKRGQEGKLSKRRRRWNDESCENPGETGLSSFRNIERKTEAGCEVLVLSGQGIVLSGWSPNWSLNWGLNQSPSAQCWHQSWTCIFIPSIKKEHDNVMLPPPWFTVQCWWCWTQRTPKWILYDSTLMSCETL